MIHDTAIVSKKAKVSHEANIGPYSIIGDEVEISSGVEIMSHVCVSGRTYIGEGTKVFPFACIGYIPQDLKYNNEKSTLIIGKNNLIREYVTMHPGTESGRMETTVGDSNLFMIGVHIAHDCIVGNRNIFGNNATLAGHVIIEDDIVIGGLSAIHQFTRVGHGSVIGGLSGVERDVIPYGAVKGERAHLYGLNLVGLKRSGTEKDKIFSLIEAYKILFENSSTFEKNIKIAEEKFKNNVYVSEVIKFLKAETQRSFCLPKRT